MLPRIRERIANEVRQGGGGNPFNQMNFGNNNNNNAWREQQRRQQGLAIARNELADIAANHHQRQHALNNPAAAAAADHNNNNNNPPPGAPHRQYVRPADLYLGCSTRVRRELLRINEWDRMISIKDVWTKQVAEAPTQEDLDQQREQEEEEAGAGAGQRGAAAAAPNNNNNHHHHNNNNHHMDPLLGPNAQLLQFLNGGAGGGGAGRHGNNNNNNANNNNNHNHNQNENSDHDIREIMDLNIKKQRFRPAFYKVQFFNPTYAANLDLMKLFHKRHMGNPKLAAQQFCRYWDVKLQYFGLEQLCKPLSLKALSSQDKACLHNGCMQLSRDEHGRTVLCLLPSLLTKEQANGPKKAIPMDVDGDNNNNNDDSSTNNNDAAGEDDLTDKLVCPHLVRALWYLVFRALQDKGETNMVILLLGQDKDDLFGKTILHCTSVLREALPFHVVALHYLDGPGMSTLEEQQNDATAPRRGNNNAMDNFLIWQQPQPPPPPQEIQEDMHGFGGLEQVAEWGGAVQVPDQPDNNHNNHNLMLMLPGSQDAEQQRRMLKKSKASLEHLEDRVGRNVRLRLRFHNWFQLRLEELAANSRRRQENNNNNENEKDDDDDLYNEDPFHLLRKRLGQFGIPNLPLNSDGTLIMHNPIDASSKRFFFTRPEDSLSSNLILPTSKDILLGKGRPYQEHPGNIALNDVIDKHRNDYTSCKSRSSKTAMSQSILETIQNQGGRFLIKKSKDDDLWVIAPAAKARDKIAHSFRLPRKHLKEAMKAKQLKEQQQQEEELLGMGVVVAPVANGATAASTAAAAAETPPNQPSLLQQQRQQQQQLPQLPIMVQPNGQQLMGGGGFPNNMQV